MNKVKILHCADLHFDTPFKEFKGVLADKSKEEIKEVFSNIIDLCLKEKVDILLLAGDIFDNLSVNKTTLKFIGEELGRLGEIKVFISPGNHDPFNSKSFYNLVDWPKNVKIFGDKLEGIELRELEVKVWGIGFNQKHINECLISTPKINSLEINIMVVHGEIVGGESNYNPITLEDIRKSGMDYIALGHKHGFSGIQKEGETFYAYSGCPQGRGFDELGNKGIILGDVAKGANNLEFKSVCLRKYLEEVVDITGCFGYEEVCRKIMDKVSEENRNNDFIKVILKGEIEDGFNINEEILIEKLKKIFYFVKIIDKTTVKFNVEDFENEFSIKAMYAKKILKKIEESTSEEEKDVLMLSLKLGLQSLTREEVNLDDY